MGCINEQYSGGIRKTCFKSVFGNLSKIYSGQKAYYKLETLSQLLYVIEVVKGLSLVIIRKSMVIVLHSSCQMLKESGIERSQMCQLSYTYYRVEHNYVYTLSRFVTS